MRKKPKIKVYLTAYHPEVTGSRYLLVIEFPDGRILRILVDCGYFQEIKYRYLNYVDDLDPKTIDAIIITHNHADHTGLLPKFVRNGFSGKIYMSNITQELCSDFLKDMCSMQSRNALEMKQLYPKRANMFKPLYYKNDVERTLTLIEGKEYDQPVEILPGVTVTFYKNGHILGASFVFMKIHYEGMQDINMFFTGDYRLKNCFFDVPKPPKKTRRLPMIVIHEATYGNTTSQEIKKCFKSNMIEAFKKRMDILLGGFAQGRYQEELYELKCWQKEGIIPPEYEIWADGALGIATTFKYMRILKRINPEVADFLPEGIKFLNKNNRDEVWRSNKPKIVVTTSGMLSNGPARLHVPFFLGKFNALIHLIGYAAEQTLARALLDCKREKNVMYASNVYQKNALVKTTREKTSHVLLDEAIEFLKDFSDIRFLGITHGEQSSKENFERVAIDEGVALETGLVDRENMYVITQDAPCYADYCGISVKRLPSKLGTQFETFEKDSDSRKRKKGFSKKNAVKKVRKTVKRSGR